MAALKDPRQPKKNSRLTYIDRLMRDSWSSYRQAREHSKQREAITSLRERIDNWLAEPEWVYDLAKGQSKKVTRERWSKNSSLDASFPFDEADDIGDYRFFFSTGILSELFTPEQMKVDQVRACILGRAAYMVLRLEKIRATENPTSMHFFSDRVFERYVQSPSAKNIVRNRYVVLADPAGHREGHSLVAGSYNDQIQAWDRALELSKKFDIRFLVARVDGIIDVH